MAVELGWVTQPTSRDAVNTVGLLEHNRRIAAALRPPFTSIWFEDHFQWENLPTIEAWTAMAYMAGEFPQLQVGTLTLGQSYRNPALTAKMGAMLQAISGGRFICGIGAGWKEDEYLAYGYPFPGAGRRIAELREAVEIIKLMWAQSPASYQGKYYQIANAHCEPRHPTPPPILIGGGGERKTLRVVAELADWWNAGFARLETYREKVAILERHCADVGRDPSTIRLTYYGHVALGRREEEVERIDRIRPNLYRIAGTPAAVAAELNSFIDFGVETFMLKFADYPQLGQYELFMSEVVPLMRLGVRREA